jgi:hypothetical protein
MFWTAWPDAFTKLSIIEVINPVSFFIKLMMHLFVYYLFHVDVCSGNGYKVDLYKSFIFSNQIF